MTEFINTLNSLDNAQQNAFYAKLRESGFTDDDILCVQSFAFYSKLWSVPEKNPDAYRLFRNDLGHMLYKYFMES